MPVHQFFLPVRAVFGLGALGALSAQVKQNDRIMLVSDEGLLKAGVVGRVTDILTEKGCKTELFTDVPPNPAVEQVEKAMAALRAFKPAKVVAVGGGSPLDLGKIVAALATNQRPLEDYQWNGYAFERAALPFIAIPTTAGTGSEATRCAVVGDRGIKKGINSDRLFASAAIVDPELMAGLPPYLTATTGMDALTHAIESYTGLGAQPITDAWAEKAIALIGRSLPAACADGRNMEARSDMAAGSMLAGVAMDQAGLGMVHAMSGPLCTQYHLAHGEANALLLEYVMRFNLPACAHKYRRVAEFLGHDTAGLTDMEAAARAVEAVSDLFQKTGVKVDVKKYGVTAGAADAIAEGTCRMYMLANNPRKPTPDECRQVFLNMLSDN